MFVPDVGLRLNQHTGFKEGSRLLLDRLQDAHRSAIIGSTYPSKKLLGVSISDRFYSSHPNTLVRITPIPDVHCNPRPENGERFKIYICLKSRGIWIMY